MENNVESKPTCVKVCYRRFTPNASKKHRPNSIKLKAIKLYLNGMSINAIFRVLQIPYMTVWTWINKEGQKADKKVMRELEFRSLEIFFKYTGENTSSGGI